MRSDIEVIAKMSGGKSSKNAVALKQHITKMIFEELKLMADIGCVNKDEVGDVIAGVSGMLDSRGIYLQIEDPSLDEFFRETIDMVYGCQYEEDEEYGIDEEYREDEEVSEQIFKANRATNKAIEEFENLVKMLKGKLEDEDTDCGDTD